jgi:hypothetical protein
VLYLSNGDVYDGEYIDGRKQGYGRYTRSSGEWYEGELQQNKRHGQGMCQYQSERKYIGGYVGGNKEVKGVFIDANEESFSGVWKKIRYMVHLSTNTWMKTDTKESG